MEAFDVIKDVGPCLGQSQVAATTGTFAFYHAEEPLGRRVISAMADSTHAAENVVISEEALVLAAGELRAAIRMQHQRLPIRTLPASHQHRLDHHVPIMDIEHRPADDLMVEQVEHGAQRQPTLGGVDVGDVSHPLGVGLQRREVAFQVILDVVRSHTRAFALPRALLRHAEQTVPGHQPSHAITAGRLACIGKILIHARHAHHAIAGGMELPDAGQQSLIVDRTCTQGALAPSMKVAGRHPQASTHQLDRGGSATALDRLILQLDSLAKDAAASRKKSLSFFTRASSRLRVATS